MKCIISIFALCATLGLAHGHGRLIDPASRNAMWRFGFPNPSNYNDNEQNCGGFSTQWSRNKGKCGVCGDPYHEKVQPHVEPGRYANGIIAETYRAGQIIDVAVDITSNHQGWFEFRVGAKGDGPIKQSDLTYLLPVVGSKRNPNRFYIPKGTANEVFKAQVKLPDDLVCEQCVFQWWYNTGNSWGCDKVTKKCGIGYGPQESFVNCADIAIIPSDGKPSPNTRPPKPETPRPRPTRPATKPRTEPPAPATKPKTNPPRPTPGSGKCVAIGMWQGNHNMDVWCEANCKLYCPPTHCKCS